MIKFRIKQKLVRVSCDSPSRWPCWVIQGRTFLRWQNVAEHTTLEDATKSLMKYRSRFNQ